MENEPTVLDNKTSTLLEIFPPEFMNLNGNEQVVSLQIYRLLAQGQPVSLARVAKSTGLKQDSVAAIVDAWPGVYRDDAHRIVGYWGLALPEMAHKFRVNGLTLYTWCAWDALFIPGLIQETAEVESKCAQTGEKIRLTITPDGITKTDPDELVLSFITPEEAKIKENIITNFCHFVHLFESPAAGEQWVSEHPGTFILSLEEGYLLGRKKNERQYKDIL